MRAWSILPLLLAATPLAAQAPTPVRPDYQSSPERRTVQDKDWGQWLGPFRAKLVPSLMQDFGERYLYAPADAALAPPKPGEQRVVFFGDSITDKWDLTASFPGKPYVNRGIGSQVTAQMILRFHQDVIALDPAAVVILAGVNDVQGFLQVQTAEQIETNYETMADLADRHGIKVVFASVLPVSNYTEQSKDVLNERHPEELRALNAWLRQFCSERGYAFADYYSVLADDHGLLARGLSKDGVHPLAEGYARMAPVAEAAIERALASRASDARKRR
ncbi:GDSL-type esterase/lipase family protein [Sphingomonas nostoxanthinifaciens]|uniref:GDSL-type esterase/lipase family protein n=1 Tax=Sphingomonas nostoxanthinifaciens TaxID=2872652 RepID=UPI001CC20A15|nr:GDSL-type esterase/lipase family protein [Sphingomonas nostoxanthinifaciens]UAK22962.1 GDSL family lipase [Sphingomonas nostoxanthinifaciens]